MISFFEPTQLYLKTLWTYWSAVCRISDVQPVYISYQTLRGAQSSILVQIGLLAKDTKEVIVFSGVGSLRTAFNKAFSEVLESKLAQEMNVSSEEGRSGFACARSLTEAQINAYGELIERDAFVQHFIIPTLASRRLPIVTIESEVIEAAELQSADPNIKVVMAASRRGDNRRVLGLGNAATVQDALTRAVNESLMLAISFTPSISANQPRKTLFSRHYEASASPEVSVRLDQILAGKGREISRFCTSIQDSHIKAQREFCKSRVAIKAEHNSLLSLTFGNRWIESQSRLKEIVTMRGLDPQEIPPHPIL
jgi:hypothetical protein